jgi:hypothetical protein
MVSPELVDCAVVALRGKCSHDGQHTTHQQYGLSRAEVDAAVQTYQEMSNMDRSMLTSLGSGTLQNFLRRIFGGSSSGQSSMMGTGTGAGMVNDQFMSNVSRILTTTLSTGRVRFSSFSSDLSLSLSDHSRTLFCSCPTSRSS